MPNCRSVHTAAALSVMFLLASAASAQEKRYALLIGNQTYDPSVGVLKNPHNDIALVKESLASQGFELLPLIKDAKRSAILGAVRELAGKLRAAGPGAVGFFYYSGHGAAEKDTNTNYLIPVDAKDPGTVAFWDDSLRLDDIMKLLDQAHGAVKFVVFDACRNELQLPTRDTSKGLMPVAEQQGFFVAYASAPGRTATDRGEKSGPYAAALASELRRQGLDHLNLFQNVKESVIATTGGSQHPWESNGLTRRVYLTGEPTTPADMAMWENVRSTNKIDALESYLGRFPSGVFAATARQMIERLKAEEAQRTAAAQAEMERKAIEAEQAEALRNAIADARAAMAAAAAAEARRVAAEKAAGDGQQSPAAAQALRAEVSAAEARAKAAEERLAALERDSDGRRPSGLSREDEELLRKTEETRVRKAALEAESIRKFQEEQRTTREIKLSHYMGLNKQCQQVGFPAVEIVKKPKYGTITYRTEPYVLTTSNISSLRHCVGLKGTARVLYYVINEKNLDQRGTDYVSVRLRFVSNTRLEDFEVQLEGRSAARTKMSQDK